MDTDKKGGKSKEQGARSREQGAGSREQGAGSEDGRWKIAGNIEHRTPNIEHPTSNEARIYFTGANRDRGERKEFQTTDGHGWTRIKSKS